VSVSLVILTSFPFNSKIRQRAFDISRLSSFSRVPSSATAPPSSPPWPASITYVIPSEFLTIAYKLSLLEISLLKMLDKKINKRAIRTANKT
jgi:hypothetical protein